MFRTDLKVRWTIRAEEAAPAGGRQTACPGRRPKAPSASRSSASPHFRASTFTPRLHSWTCLTNPIRIALTKAVPAVRRLSRRGDAAARACGRKSGDDIFNSWFGRLALVSVGSGQARLSVPTRFLKSWIDTHYVGHISAALNCRIRPGGANPHFRALLRAPRAGGQKSAGRMRRLRPGRRPGRPSRAAIGPQPNAARPAERRRACVRRRSDRLSPRSAVDLRDLSGRAVERTRLSRRASAWPSVTGAGLRGLLPALRPFGGRSRQDPSPAGGRAYRREPRPLGHLSDRREIHVRVRRRAPVPDVDRLQGAAENDRPPHFRRRAVPAGKGDPGRIRSCAECPARRRARGDRGRRPPSERSGIARRARALAARASAFASRSARSTSRCG